MLASLYGGIAVFAALAPGLELTSCQVTVLCSVMLFAHSLPVELSVSKRAGANLIPIGFLRVFEAVVYAFLLNQMYLYFDIWQEKATLLFKDTGEPGNFLQWAVGLLQNLGLIILIIFSIVLCMRIFRVTGLLSLLEKILTPVLLFFGMGRQLAEKLVVSFGGGLFFH